MMSPIVQKLFAIAECWPENIAIVEVQKSVTYAAFKDMVIHLAGEFARHAKKPRIVICGGQSAHVYAAMFASLLAGGFYVPLNAESGESRVETALREIEPDLIFTDQKHVIAMTAISNGCPVLTSNVLQDVSPTVLASRRAHHLAYVIFTSGSTGTPKGVMISQKALGHYVEWAQATMAITPTDRWSQHPNIGFDLSVLDIFGALCSGATLVPLGEGLDRLFPARAIRRHRLTIWNSVPSVMGMMLASGDWTKKNVASLRLLTFCGEPLLPQHVEGIHRELPDVTVHNTYGPTEATVSCTLVRLTRQNYREHAGTSIALGEAIPGMELAVDGDEKGELLIAGPQLADGYWNDAERTARSFVTLILGGLSQRYYRTGDLVERNSRGLFFSERLDRQVKLKGYRIELDEISSQIRQLGYIHAETIVDGQFLICFVEAEHKQSKVEAIKSHLAKVLEKYMQPQQIVFIKRFPRNPNDKIDITSLKAFWDLRKQDPDTK
jgi:D-alanine--poly(phosphoribitol) ligase subunit 1